MSKFENVETGLIVSVADSKDSRFVMGWKAIGSNVQATRSETPDKSWKVDELKEFAAGYDIELGAATKKDDILAVITAELEEGPALEESTE